jgi:predicted methyltransferase
MRLTEKVHQLLSEHLRCGDFAIDATAGNGHDTVLLARLVGTSGRTLAIDVQPSALEVTHARLLSNQLQTGVTLQLSEHAQALETLATGCTGAVAAIVFNLGYLPGSDKTIQTQSTTTGRALNAAAHLLRPQGLLCVTAYRAHPGGEDEASTVEQWMQAKASESWDIQSHIPPSPNQPPILWVAKKPTLEPQ